MPRFSVIVPAFRVQAYLTECLESVLSQSCSDLELIVVDDCSPDACGDLVDEFAARDPRVRPVHLPEHSGPGPARNVALALARGDHLLFLHGDDVLVPGALRAVAGRLKETGEPDLLVFGATTADWRGEPVADDPGGTSWSGWNRTYRREFVQREGLMFPPGRHEGLPWAAAALLTAGSAATLDRVCVRRRAPLPSAPTEWTAEDVADLFEQYDRVFAFVGTRPGLADRRPWLYRRMVEHLAQVCGAPGPLPRGARAAFLRRARAHCRRHYAPGAPAPLRARFRHALVRHGAHRVLRALLLAAALRRRTARRTIRLARALRSAALRLHYRVQRCLPLRADRAVFAASWGHGGYGCHPAALEEAFRTHAPHVRTAWVARPEQHHTLPTATRRLTPGTAAYWTALARSTYLVDNTGFDRRLVKRPGQVLIQTQHGTPLKHMGLDLQERPAAARGTDFAALVRDCARWDHVVSGNRLSTLTWERVHPGGWTTLEYGSPRNDVLQRASAADVARLRECLGVPRGTVAILYAPTYRDHRRTQQPVLDLDRVARRLGPRFVILARAHHRHGGPLTETADGRVIDVTGHPRVESLCLAADALVTDYSSIMFDYAGLDRPIVLHLPDREAFEAARGTYFDLRSFPPGALARTEDELIDIFATGHWRGSRSTQLRAAFRARFCPYDDGYAAERVVRRVVLGQRDETQGLPAVVPPAQRRPVPSAASAPGPGPLPGGTGRVRPPSLRVTR
ncbi:bifunctional glycosyltransferase/CDP-glycerol:glycerophosphate glycerophosphotransferase [Streptomyces broussonetiae]|uniref:Bifunctional glycosyltransferase family 2 protein/CDP-glycerol:glycerophosphate glycerophosphotransferase n=1 Tax=Streptomyces broussonetiae TaxID=2686304 RepID=A0ABV5EKN7_9ACTN